MAKPRIDPFALPSETGQRFRLLLLIATSAAYSMGTLWVYRFGPEEPSLGEIGSAGLAAVALLWLGALVIYVVNQLRIPGSHGGLLPPGHDPRLSDRLATLSAGRSPQFLVGRDIHDSAALAYGFPWSRRILLGGALRQLLRRDPGGFDAIVRHELAHHQNRDVGAVFAARAVFWMLVALSVAHTCIWLPASIIAEAGPGSLSQIGWWLPELLAPAGFLLAAYADYAGLLRAREHYADWRAAAAGSDEDLRRLLAAAPPAPAESQVRRLLRLHPTLPERLDALDRPERAGDLERGSMVALGMAGAFVLCAWADLLSDLEAGNVVDTRLWELDNITDIMEQMSASFGALPFILLTILFLIWGSAIGTAAQRYWAVCASKQIHAHPGRASLLSAAFLVGLGVALGIAVWPTNIFALSFDDVDPILEWLRDSVIGVPIGFVMTLVVFFSLWPFVRVTSRVLRGVGPPGWFLSMSVVAALYLFLQVVQLALILIGVLDADGPELAAAAGGAIAALIAWSGGLAFAAWRSHRRSTPGPLASTPT